MSNFIFRAWGLVAAPVNVSVFVVRTMARVTVAVWVASLFPTAPARADIAPTQLFLFGMRPSTSYHVVRNGRLVARPESGSSGEMAWLNYSWKGAAFVVTTAPLELSPATALNASLQQNYPNPFNPSTRIPFAIVRPGRVVVRIFDVRGGHVATLFDGNLPSGRHWLEWLGRDERGAAVASGMYFYTLTTDGGTLSRKMLVLK